MQSTPNQQNVSNNSQSINNISSTGHQANVSLKNNSINNGNNSQTISNFLRMNALSNANNSNTNGSELIITNNDLTSNASINLSNLTNLSMSNNSNSLNNNLSNNNNNNSNTSLLDLIMCKLSVPFHVINDPRLLECGASACFRCITTCKDNERNLKCSYCNNVHKIPVDANKLIVNKSLQNFIKTNLRPMNENFSKQLEDSMLALEQKIHGQNLSMENLNQYLTLVQNDVQTKLDVMKSHVEYGEHFLENLKLIRKEVQKQCLDHSSSFSANTQLIVNRLTNDTLSNNNTNNNTTSNSIAHNNNNLTNLNHQSHFSQNMLIGNNQLAKDKTFQIIGLKNDNLQNNLNVLAVLNNTNGINSNHTTYQLNNSANTTTNNHNNNHHHHNNNHQNNSTNSISQQNDKQQRNQNNSLLNNPNSSTNNNSKSSLLQHNDSLTASLDVLQNTFNFSNSSSWHANDDDLDDFEADINIKPVQTTVNNGKRHLNKEQAQFNKFVREEVSKKFGEDFLLQHEVNQLESGIMEIIKTEALATYLPKDTTPARAWTLAKVSLRSLKRDLRRKQGITLKKETQDAKMHIDSYYDV